MPSSYARSKRRPRPTRRYRNLVDYFARSGTTQVQLARTLHISQAQISRIASGVRIPRPALAYRLVMYCNIPIDSFAKSYYARRGLGDVA